jgi:hypothetical protein
MIFFVCACWQLVSLLLLVLPIANRQPPIAGHRTPLGRLKSASKCLLSCPFVPQKLSLSATKVPQKLRDSAARNRVGGLSLDASN